MFKKAHDVVADGNVTGASTKIGKE